jgi:hypothetical protein
VVGVVLCAADTPAAATAIAAAMANVFMDVIYASSGWFQCDTA